MDAKHTTGPWRVTIYGGFDAPRVWSDDGSIALIQHHESGAQEGEANARLIAAAPDHAMFGRAITSLGARWEKWDEKRGEFCIGGFRYATDIDEFGVPVLNAPIRAAIAKAEGR